MQEMDLINADVRAMGDGSSITRFVVLGEETANRSFINADFIGNLGEGASERLLDQVADQAFRHAMMLIHLWKCFEKGFPTLAAQGAASDDQDTDALASDWSIHELLGLGAVSVQAVTATMQTAGNHRCLFGGDPVVVCALLNRQNAPMRPAKNIQPLRSQFIKILPDEFSERLTFPVFKKRCFPTNFRQIYSTRYAEFWNGVCGRAFLHDMPNSPKMSFDPSRMLHRLNGSVVRREAEGIF